MTPTSSEVLIHLMDPTLNPFLAFFSPEWMIWLWTAMRRWTTAKWIRYVGTSL